jgi:hypothetical protein
MWYVAHHLTRDSGIPSLKLPTIKKDHGMASSTITSFSGTNGSKIALDGTTAIVQNANQPWSLTEPNSDTLQFSVEPGDHWSTSGWSDLTDDNGAERSEIAISPNYSAGTEVNISYGLTVEPGSTNTASWLVLNQMHATTEGSPPFGIYMDGEHMEIVVRYQTPGTSTVHEAVVYRDPNPIQRGQTYNMNIQVDFDPSGNGFLNVYRDGTQIVNYKGALGIPGAQYYWKEGIYRAAASETLTADYSNLQITTGAPTTPVSGTTSSGSGTTTGTVSGGTTGSSSGTTSGSTSGTTSGGTTDPTGSTSTGSTSGSTGSTTATAPSLTVADHSLSVAPGKSVALGLGVTVPNSNDTVKVTISGLPPYETITDNLDHKTFTGKSITLTAAEVNSGLTLTSNYRGSGQPTANLTITAKDSAGLSIAPQTITVKDPPATTSSGSTGTGTWSGNSHHQWWNDHHAATSTSSVTSTPSSASTGSGTSATTPSTLSGQPSASRTAIAQWFHDHPGFAAAATTLSEAGASGSKVVSNPTATQGATPSVGATAYALLNQMMAHDMGAESHFGQMTPALSGASPQQASFLTRPVH